MKRGYSEKMVYAVRESESEKLGPVAATYVSQTSCPSSCPFLNGGGCYAENGPVALVATKRLNAATPEGTTAGQLARIEARAIDGLRGDLDLRLHVVGDSTTEWGTVQLATASEAYMRRGGRRVWTYTHSWRTVPRVAWGDVSVLASCETPEEVREAEALGYATAIVVDAHGTDRVQLMDGHKTLPCPQQTRGVTCAECRICTDDRRLHAAGITVAFAAHGGTTSRKRALETVARRRDAEGTRERRTNKGCSIIWCDEQRERFCGTCARGYCLAHVCDQHEIQNKAYRATNGAAGVTQYRHEITR